jgi:hypothetical protein
MKDGKINEVGQKCFQMKNEKWQAIDIFELPICPKK